MCACLISMGMCQRVYADNSQDLTEMSLEALMNIEVTSVSKHKESTSEVATSIFVITKEDIRRSGVVSIPEALRMAPGLHVARIDTNRYAITSRGFNSLFADDLLVLMDGRTVYTPLFSGVYWDVQDTVMEDIERIEVIRGPGVSVWGANAVNGVINIITKHSKDTKGGLVSSGAGNEEAGFASVRYGTQIGKNGTARIYTKYLNRDHSQDINGGAAFDHINSMQSGFRSDWSEGIDTVTIQGDMYRGTEGLQATLFPNEPPFMLQDKTRTDFSGGNLLARIEREHSEEVTSSLQIYYDKATRKDFILQSDFDTFDIDEHTQVHISESNQLNFGFNYRSVVNETLSEPPGAFFHPANRDTNLFRGFVQDEILIFDKQLRLTVGSMFEHNDFTGFEVQPTARAAWMIDESSMLWSGISRAVRVPNRVDDNINFNLTSFQNPDQSTTIVRLEGNDAFESPVLVSYELGYRLKPAQILSFDVSAFYNDYDRRQSTEYGTPFLESSGDTTYAVVPVSLQNKAFARSFGTEVVASYQPYKNWQLQAWYSYLNVDQSLDDTSTQPSISDYNDPRNQFSLRSLLSLPHDLELDAHLRFVDSITNYYIKDYTELNMRLGWRPYKAWEFAVVGQNLLQDSHREYITEFVPIAQTAIQRSVFAKVIWRFN